MPIRKDEVFFKHFLGETEEEAKQVYNNFYATVELLATNYATFGVDKDDLIQEGLIGLARAVKTFDEDRSKGEKAFRIFAIYHIKNAMREFVTKQSLNLKTPQYLRDGIRLIIKIKELLRQAGEPIDFIDVFELWRLAENRSIKTTLDKEIKNMVNKFLALCKRSSSSVYDLLRRLEPLPLQTSELDLGDVEIVNYEDYIINTISLNEQIQWLMEILTEEEFDLLWQRYVNNVPLRVLADKMGVSAVSVGNILRRLKLKISKRAKREMS